MFTVEQLSQVGLLKDKLIEQIGDKFHLFLSFYLDIEALVRSRKKNSKSIFEGLCITLDLS